MYELHCPTAYGKPACTGRIKQQPEDFQVIEDLGFEPEGSGEHLYLFITKRGHNTRFVQELLARAADVPLNNVSYSGLKDRHAVTSQWFSIWLPGRDIETLSLDESGIEIERAVRHNRKLRRGTHNNNRFSLRLREIGENTDGLEERLAQVAQNGFPNYFGNQRFGFRAANLEKVSRIRKKRRGDDILLSSARSYLFNQVLSARVTDASWLQLSAGELAMLDGSHSVFVVEEMDEVLQSRLTEFDIHPTGPMWGRGNPRTEGPLLALEMLVAEQYPQLSSVLEQFGMKQERRALRARADHLNWQWLDKRTLQLDFVLPTGCYATALLNQIVEVVEQRDNERLDKQ
ncbi:MAG: tRNA pseudouridine(13) synthase TruD [Pseudomonadales bacterium]